MDTKALGEIGTFLMNVVGWLESDLAHYRRAPTRPNELAAYESRWLQAIAAKDAYLRVCASLTPDEDCAANDKPDPRPMSTQVGQTFASPEGGFKLGEDWKRDQRYYNRAQSDKVEERFSIPIGTFTPVTLRGGFIAYTPSIQQMHAQVETLRMAVVQLCLAESAAMNALLDTGLLAGNSEAAIAIGRAAQRMRDTAISFTPATEAFKPLKETRP